MAAKVYSCRTELSSVMIDAGAPARTPLKYEYRGAVP